MLVVSSLGLVSYGGHEDDSDQEAQRSDVEQSPNAPISDGTVKVWLVLVGRVEAA